MPYGLQLKWTIEGVSELSRRLMTMRRKVSDFKKPLFRASQLILKDVEKNFETEGGLVGGWKELEPPTVRDRRQKGFPGEHPILQRTGKLKRSFKGIVGKKRAVVSSFGVPYYKYHQSRKPRKKLPRRAMLVLTKRTRQNIVEEFQKFVRFK